MTKKRKQKTRGEILQTATERVEDYGGYFKGQRIYYTLVNLWKTAFTRGYDKALRDQSKPLKNAIKYVQEASHDR
jgi:phage-related tail protein